MVPPCYPDEGCFLAMDGSVLLDDPNAFLGQVLKGRGVPNHEYAPDYLPSSAPPCKAEG